MRVGGLGAAHFRFLAGLPKFEFGRTRIAAYSNRFTLEILTGENRHIWIRGLTRETMTRLTYSGNRNTDPIWNPDGKRIGFSSSSARRTRAIFCKAADGAGEIEELCSAPTAALIPQSWSSDGEIMVAYPGIPERSHSTYPDYGINN